MGSDEARRAREFEISRRMKNLKKDLSRGAIPACGMYWTPAIWVRHLNSIALEAAFHGAVSPRYLYEDYQ